MPKFRIQRHRCPHADCRSNREDLRPRLTKHSILTTKRGERRRLRCAHCKRTFVTTAGTAYHRLRRSREDFDRTMRMLVEGVAPIAIARSQRMSAATIVRWRERACAHAWNFASAHLRVDEPHEIQFDELKARCAGEGDDMWVFNSIEVWTRLWMNWRIGRRTYRGTLVMARETCSRIRTMASPVVCSSDEMKYYAVSLRRVFAVAGVHVQVDNRYSGGRLMRTNSKLMTGPQWRYEQARSRSEDSKKPNTSYVERLQLTLRRGCSYLHRRTNGPMRNRWRLAESVAILHCYYNFVRRHASLRFGKVVRTPAMQAGICDRALTFRDIFSWCPRPVARPSLLPVT